jgi:AraC-like DNA-binding protein
MLSILERPAQSVAFAQYEATPSGRLIPRGDPSARAHYHDTYELLLLRSGSGTLACAGRTVAAVPGTCVLLAPGLVHSHAGMRSAEAWSVHFRAADVDLVLPLVDSHVGAFGATERAAIDAVLSAMLSGRIASAPIARLQLTAIVAALLGPAFRVPRSCVGSPVVKAALDIIDRNYAALRGPSDVAGAVGKNLSYLTDMVRTETGYPIAVWLREKRLFAASLLLADPAPSIIDVALSVGFGDAGHFARQFSRRFGMAPSEWRARVLNGSFASGDAPDA